MASNSTYGPGIRTYVNMYVPHTYIWNDTLLLLTYTSIGPFQKESEPGTRIEVQ